MKIEILKSREVDVRAKKFGTMSENKVEKLEFIFPKRLWRLYKNYRI